eukprot:Sdes_comp15496_c0_seq1m4422
MSCKKIWIQQTSKGRKINAFSAFKRHGKALFGLHKTVKRKAQEKNSSTQLNQIIQTTLLKGKLGAAQNLQKERLSLQFKMDIFIKQTSNLVPPSNQLGKHTTPFR